MVKHIILWTLKEELSEDEKSNVKKDIKTNLESLKGKIDGLVDIKVLYEGRLSSSNAEVMLDSTFESAEALKVYSAHPDHIEAANTYVRPYTASRSCLDFEI